MSQYDDFIQQAASQYNVDPNLLRGVIQTESGGKPGAVSNAGAVGLMQIEPATAQQYGVTGDLKDPKTNIFGGAQILSHLLDTSPDVTTALRRYQGGDDQKGWGPVNAAYPAKVFAAGGIAQGAPNSAATLPGIPSSTNSAAAPSNASSLSDDAVLSAFTGGSPATPTASSTTAGPSSGTTSDDAIFSAFAKSPAAITAPPTQLAKPQASATSGAPAPTSAPGVFESGLIGFGKGVGDVASGVEQMAGHGVQALGNATGWSPLQSAGRFLVNDANAVINQTDAESAAARAAHPIAVGAGQIAGNALMTAPLIAAAPAAETIGGMAAQGAGLGALSGGLTPVSPDSQNFTADKLRQMGIGALGGAVMTPALGALGSAISPSVSPDVQALLDRGVTPTPGQILGGGWARTEDKLSSIPFLGDMIKNAQGRALTQFNQAAYNEALAPIGETFDPTAAKVGQDGIAQVKSKIQDVYNTVLPQMQFRVDPQFQTEVTNLGQMVQNLPQPQQDTFMKVLQNQIFGKMTPQGYMDGQTLKGVGEELGDKAAGYLGDGSFDNRQLGAAISALKDSVMGNVKRTSPPDLAALLNNADTAWANFARIRAAGASQGAANNEGVFTAAQLQSAVRAGDKSAGKGAFATGNALMQDLSGAGQRVLGTRYPDSGTVGRGLMALLAPGSIGAGLISAPGSTLATLGGIGAGALPYTGLGQRAAASLLTARPAFAAPVGQAVTGLGRLAVPATLPAFLPGGQ